MELSSFTAFRTERNNTIDIVILLEQENRSQFREHQRVVEQENRSQFREHQRVILLHNNAVVAYNSFHNNSTSIW